MLSTRSGLPVSTVIARSTRPRTAMQECPGLWPYRLPVGPAVPVSPNDQVVSSRSLILRANSIA